MRATHLAAAAAWLVGASSHAGVITEVDAFTGDLQEGFESFAYGEVPAGPHAIFGGAATIAFDGDPFNYLWVFSPPGTSWEWGLGSGVAAQPVDGEKGMAIDGEKNDLAVIEFSDPVAQFGGYFGTDDDSTSIDVRFYDAGGALIDVGQVLYDAAQQDGVLAWGGWSSTTPIARVEIQDALQAIAVPGPGGAVLLVLPVRSRRRR